MLPEAVEQANGTRMVVGAPRVNRGEGSATIYDYEGSNWALSGGGIVSDKAIGGRARCLVSLSNDRDALAVGVFHSSKGNLIKSGSMSLHKLDSSSYLDQGQTLLGPTVGAWSSIQLFYVFIRPRTTPCCWFQWINYGYCEKGGALLCL